MRFTQTRIVLIAAVSMLAVMGCSSHHDQAQTSTPAMHPSTSKGQAPLKLNAQNVDVAMTLVGTPKITADGKNIAVTVDLSNHGKTPLSSSSKPPVHLGAHSVNLRGKIVNMDLARASFATLNPGSSTHVTIMLPTHGTLGYKAEILPVQEGVAWFDSWGTKPLDVGPFKKCPRHVHGKVCNKNGKPLATAGKAQ